MEANLFIKYKGLGINDSEIDLATLGESIIGFDVAIKEIFKISKINADLNISVSKTRKGSLIVDLILNAILYKDHIPFDKVPDLLNFLEIANHDLWVQAKDYFKISWGVAEHVHRTANDYFADNPLDQDALVFSLGVFIKHIFDKARGQKKYPDISQLPKEYAVATHKMIRNHKFKKALKPFVEDKVKSISMSNDYEFKNETVVNEGNFDNYLSEEEKILPNYENGKKYLFTGKIVAMQCSKGDSLKLQVHGFSRKERDLVTYPPEGKTTKDLDDFYEEDVAIEAIIERGSLYQKPKLHIVTIKRYQQSLL
jgi:hypothetical protein